MARDKGKTAFEGETQTMGYERTLPETTPVIGNVERLMERVDLPGSNGATTRRITYQSGREVQLSDTGNKDLLVIRNPQGEVELSVQFTAVGPVLHFSAAAVNLKTPGEMMIDCGKLKVKAADAIEFTAGGDLKQTVDGELTTQVEGKSAFEAHTVNIKSRRGNINLKANDDVRVDGERIKLNS